MVAWGIGSCDETFFGVHGVLIIFVQLDYSLAI